MISMTEMTFQMDFLFKRPITTINVEAIHVSFNLHIALAKYVSLRIDTN